MKVEISFFNIEIEKEFVRFLFQVSLHPTNNRRNFLQAYMADQLSPILGDQFFSYRVKNLMGHPTAVSHLHTPGECGVDEHLEDRVRMY